MVTPVSGGNMSACCTFIRFVCFYYNRCATCSLSRDLAWYDLIVALIITISRVRLIQFSLQISKDQSPPTGFSLVMTHKTYVKQHNFSVYTASTIAASSIAAALSGLNWHLRTGQGEKNFVPDFSSYY
ncbi:hypothetical protein GQX74_007322 [Glossina fuscipes]|nr:hypothetical protein GQX74_007322 [Glossina fuscipes]